MHENAVAPVMVLRNGRQIVALGWIKVGRQRFRDGCYAVPDGGECKVRELIHPILSPGSPLSPGLNCAARLLHLRMLVADNTSRRRTS
jgi:hypothetical protein